MIWMQSVFCVADCILASRYLSFSRSNLSNVVGPGRKRENENKALIWNIHMCASRKGKQRVAQQRGNEQLTKHQILLPCLESITIFHMPIETGHWISNAIKRLEFEERGSWDHRFFLCAT